MSGEIGIKLDTGKVQLGLLPGRALAWVARIFEYGKVKYRLNNWVKLESADDLQRIRDACMRHLGLAFDPIEPEAFDQESKLPHLAHAAANLLFLLYHESAQGKIGDATNLTQDQTAVFARLAVIQAVRDGHTLRPHVYLGGDGYVGVLPLGPGLPEITVTTAAPERLAVALARELVDRLSLPSNLSAPVLTWSGLCGAALDPELAYLLG